MSPKKKMRLYTLDEIKDDLIGKKGTVKRDMYEQELRMEFLGEMIKKVRLERNLSRNNLEN